MKHFKLYTIAAIILLLLFKALPSNAQSIQLPLSIDATKKVKHPPLHPSQMINFATDSSLEDQNSAIIGMNAFVTPVSDKDYTDIIDSLNNAIMKLRLDPFVKQKAASPADRQTVFDAAMKEDTVKINLLLPYIKSNQSNFFGFRRFEHFFNWLPVRYESDGQELYSEGTPFLGVASVGKNNQAIIADGGRSYLLNEALAGWMGVIRGSFTSTVFNESPAQLDSNLPLGKDSLEMLNNKKQNIIIDSVNNIRQSDVRFQNAIDRLLSGPGNVFLTLTYPILELSTSPLTGRDIPIGGLILANVRGGYDINKYGVKDESDQRFNGAGDIEFSLWSLKGNSGLFGFLQFTFDARFALAFRSQSFFNSLGTTDNAPIAMFVLNAGIAIATNLRVTGTYSSFYGDQRIPYSQYHWRTTITIAP